MGPIWLNVADQHWNQSSGSGNLTTCKSQEVVSLPVRAGWVIVGGCVVAGVTGTVELQ